MLNDGPYDIGDLVTVKAAFTNLDGDPADPTDVTLLIRKPDGIVTEVDMGDLTNPTVGTWTYDVAIDQSQFWWYRFEGTGAVVAAEEDRFRVRTRRVPVPSS